MKKAISVVLAIVVMMAFAIPCFAADDQFVPSIERKGAYDVKTVELFDGEKTTTLTATDLTATAYNDRASASQAVSGQLETAYKELTEKKLGELVKGLDKAAAEKMEGIDASSLVVTDIFNLALEGENADELKKSGAGLTVCFDTKLGAEDKTPIVIVRDAEGKWGIADSKVVIKNSDGSLSVRFSTLGVVAMLRVSDNPVVNPPATGEEMPVWPFVLLVMAGAVAVVLFLSKKKVNA